MRPLIWGKRVERWTSVTLWKCCLSQLQRQEKHFNYKIISQNVKQNFIKYADQTLIREMKQRTNLSWSKLICTFSALSVSLWSQFLQLSSRDQFGQTSSVISPLDKIGVYLRLHLVASNFHYNMNSWQNNRCWTD